MYEPQRPIEIVKSRGNVESLIYALKVWPKALIQLLTKPVETIKDVAPDERYGPGILYWIILILVNFAMGFLFISTATNFPSQGYAALINVYYLAALLGTFVCYVIGIVLMNFVLRKLGSEPTFHETFMFMTITALFPILGSLLGLISKSIYILPSAVWLIWVFKYAQIRSNLSTARAAFFTSLVAFFYLGPWIWKLFSSANPS